jgi:hypothetical protein
MDIYGHGADIYALAERHGYRIVHTIRLDTGTLTSTLILAGAIYEHGAVAVVVPGFEHSEAIRHAITDLCALVTPMRVYRRGHRWSITGREQE